MVLEGQVNWMLVLAAVAVISLLIAILSTWYAVTHGAKAATTTTELDAVQKARDEADTRLFETLNAVPVALVQTDKQGKFVFANRAAHQLLGRRDAELIGLRFHSATWGITYPDGRPVPPDLLPSARALRGQTVKGFQHLLANPATRRKMLVSVTAMPMENELNQITGSIAAIVETEGLQTPEPQVIEVPAAPTPDLTRRVFEAASSALVVIAPQGRVREANATALAVLGRAEPPAGEDFFDLFVAADERAEARQALRAALAAPAGEAEPIRSRGGPAGPLRWNLLPLIGEDGRADAVLLAGERYFEENSASDPAATTTTEATGGIAAEAELAALRARLAAAEAELEAARLTPPVEPQAAVAEEAEDLRRTLADREGEIAAVRAEAEAARRHAAEAEERARAELDAARRLESVGRLTGGVAQDFNALLAVMTSALDLMLKQADDPSRVRRLGEAALAAGQRGEILTRRLTAFTEGQDGPPAQIMDAAVLLRGLETRLRGLAGPGVDLMIEGPSEPALARLDPVGFDGAVRALVQNAVDAVEGRGSVAVRLETLPEGLVRLSVRDSGPGLNPELAARALEPFFTTRPGQAGLGLSQAHAFARQSGGRLSIDSAPGEGAEVAIVVPAVG